MNAAPSLHPTDQTLSSYGLGKLDDRSAEAVNEHLIECSDCRKRVAEMSADSFLQRVRDAQKPSGKSTSGQPQAGGTLSDKGMNTLTSSSGDSLPPALAAHPDYEIKRELGRGGMGVVYLAHNRLMGRDEVLKLMGEHLMGDPGVLERFLREIQSVARLRHANIVTAYHATRLGGSIVFAMEYVEGLDLSKLVKTKGPTPVAHACLFIHQAALGLQHAHEKGLVHRDIKPHNLMLSREGNKAMVKILDFGLAKAAREEKVEGGVSLTGQALGTPDYIAPEQIIDAKSADIRADIYSLGGTLYYLLTGHPPFQEKSLYDLYQAHISRNADPLNLVRPDVPAELAALVAKMMAKDPAQRFQTPGEVAQALKPFFKNANAALKTPNRDLPQASPANASRTVAEAVSAVTQLETDTERRIVRLETTADPSAAESRWDSVIELPETESPIKAAPEAGPRRRSPSVWASVALGVLILGFYAAWMAGVFNVKTPEGVIVLENLPKDAEVSVDGSKITPSWPGVGKPVEIRAVPGQRKLEVNKDGFSTFVKELTVKTHESEEVTVRLERLNVDRIQKGDAGNPKVGEPPVPTAATHLIPPAGLLRRAEFETGSWIVDGDQLIKEGLGHGQVAFGDKDWTDYDLTLEVQKSTGPDGLGLTFRRDDGKFYILSIGGFANTKHVLSRRLLPDISGSELASSLGTIRPHRWYKVKVSLRGRNIRIYLDDHLLFARTDGLSQKEPSGLTFGIPTGDSAGSRSPRLTAPSSGKARPTCPDESAKHQVWWSEFHNHRYSLPDVLRHQVVVRHDGFPRIPLGEAGEDHAPCRRSPVTQRACLMASRSPPKKPFSWSVPAEPQFKRCSGRPILIQ